MHTQFDYVPDEEVPHFVKKATESKELCWIDFMDEKIKSADTYGARGVTLSKS